MRQHKMVMPPMSYQHTQPWYDIIACGKVTWHKVTPECLYDEYSQESNASKVLGNESTTPANKYRDAPKRPASKARRTLVKSKKKVKK